MTSEGLVFLILLIGTIALNVDYGLVGRDMLQVSRTTRTPANQRPYANGLGWLLLTPVGLNNFWVIALIVNSVFTVPSLILAAVYIVLVTASIVGRRRWWQQITSAVEDGHSSEEVPPDDSQNA